MISSKTDDGLEGNVLGRLNTNIISCLRILLTFSFIKIKVRWNSEIYYISYRDRSILRALKITRQCHLSFWYRQVRGKGSGWSVGIRRKQGNEKLLVWTRSKRKISTWAEFCYWYWEMAKAAFNKKRALFTSTLNLELRKKLVKCYVWSIWCWNLDASGSRSETPGKFWNVVLEEDGKDQLD
jgi:hypothetical protein